MEDIIFSSIHVFLMILIRNLSYSVMNDNNDFETFVLAAVAKFVFDL